MTIAGNQASPVAADAEQAACLKRELITVRQTLLDNIMKRRALIDRHSVTSRTRAAVRSAEAEVRYLDRLISRLDNRFTDLGV